MSSYEALSNTMEVMCQEGKGILAADESNGTIGKRFASIQVENTEAYRKAYRLLLATTPKLSEYIHSVILFEETFTQTDAHGKSIPQIFLENGIIPGIKVDQGLTVLPHTDEEQVTQGLDGLSERLAHFKTLGAQFAKWRNVYRISDSTPSLAAIKSGAENLARYASACQVQGIVPIVEPEILMDGDHPIEQAAEAAEIVLHELFHALFIHQVDLEHIVLKPSMVTSGKSAAPFSSPEEIALYTLSVFRNQVPASVPTINFLSGGQTPEQAAVNLNAMNQHSHQPWLLSFSYGRALQEECLSAWKGKQENVAAAQAALIARAKANSLASLGEYK